MLGMMSVSSWFFTVDGDQSIYGWRGARIENIQYSPATYWMRRPSAWSRTTAPLRTSSTAQRTSRRCKVKFESEASKRLMLA